MMRKKTFAKGTLILLMTGSLALTACGAAGTADQSTKSGTDVSAAAAEEEVSLPEEETPGNATAGDSAQAGLFTSFDATDLSGNPVDETIFAKDTITMVNVWATYCGPCLNEMPELGELSQEYADKGVQIIGIPIDTIDTYGKPDQAQINTAAELASQTGADYTHILPSEDLLSRGLYNIYAVTTTYFVDSKGNQIGQEYMGAKSKADWAAIIDQLLAEQEAK